MIDIEKKCTVTLSDKSVDTLYEKLGMIRLHTRSSDYKDIISYVQILVKDAFEKGRAEERNK